MTDFNKIPNGEHYAIITDASYYTDDGYGDTVAQRYPDYEAHSDMDDLKARVEQYVRSGKSYKVMRVVPLKVTVETKIEVA